MRLFRCPVCQDALLSQIREDRLYRECRRGHGIFVKEGLLFPLPKAPGQYKQNISINNPSCPGCGGRLERSSASLFCRSCSSHWLNESEAAAFKELEKSQANPADPTEALAFLPWLGGLSKPRQNDPSTSVLWLAFALIVTFFLQAHVPGMGRYAVFYPSDPLHNFGANFFLSLLSHGDVQHLCINLFFLALVGPLVEKNLQKHGTVRIFFLSGLAANFAQITLGLPHPTLGASGGIAGLVTALWLLEPEACLIFSPRPLWKGRLYLSCELMVFLWLLSELRGLLRPEDGVNHWAHLTGALAGFLCVQLGLVAASPGSPSPGAGPARAR